MVEVKVGNGMCSTRLEGEVTEICKCVIDWLLGWFL